MKFSLKDTMFIIFNKLPDESINAFSLVNNAALALMNDEGKATNKLKTYFPLEYEYFQDENLLGKNDYLLYRTCLQKTLIPSLGPHFIDMSVIDAVFKDDSGALEKALEAKGKVTSSMKLALLCPFYEIGKNAYVGLRGVNFIYWAHKWKRTSIIQYFEELVDTAYQDIKSPTPTYFCHKIIAAKSKEDIQALQQQGLDLKESNGKGLSMPAMILAQFDRADLLKIFIELGCKISAYSGRVEINIIRTACEFESIHVLRVLLKDKALCQALTLKEQVQLMATEYSNSFGVHPLILQELLNTFLALLPEDRTLDHRYLDRYYCHPIEILTELNRHKLLEPTWIDNALIKAAENNRPAFARHLLKLGANGYRHPPTSWYSIKEKVYNDVENHNSPLIIAAKKGHARVVQALLEGKGGADVHYQNKKKQSAYGLAANNEIRSVLEGSDLLLIQKLRNQLNELENGKGDELIPDKYYAPNEMCDLIAETKAYLNEKKLTAWKWIKGLFTHPINTARYHQRWKKAKTEMKNFKHVWLKNQQSNINEEKVEMLEDEDKHDQELNASKRMARKFTTNYMLSKLKKSHIEVFFGHGFGIYKLLDNETKKQFKALEKNIRTTFTGKPAKKNKTASKEGKAQIWRHAQGLFSQHDNNAYKGLGEFAKAKAELLEAEVMFYNQV